MKYKLVGVGDSNRGQIVEADFSQEHGIGEILHIDYLFWEIVEAIP